MLQQVPSFQLLHQNRHVFEEGQGHQDYLGVLCIYMSFNQRKWQG